MSLTEVTARSDSILVTLGAIPREGRRIVWAMSSLRIASGDRPMRR